MKIAMAHWQGRVSPVFDVADHLLLITVENGREILREERRLSARQPFERAQKLAEAQVDVLLCGAVSRPLEKALVGAGIQVIAFLGGGVEGILAAFLDQRLADGRLPRTDRTGRRSGIGKKRKPPVHAPGLRR
jgi:predicted Fe-Mo cluster-binding NifX family protein